MNSKVSGERQTEWALETKLIFQKNFLDDQLVWAGNLNMELAREKKIDEIEGEVVYEVTSGIGYHFAPRWFGGVEARYESKWPGLAQREAWALFVGPTLHYGAKEWWATLTWLPQVKGGPVDPAVSSRLHLEQYEKDEIRLRVGFPF